jgi:hypothetical protein|tara:strand:+ start:139 stop:261 length:123 start_codon:yes stop_codon:yes gene_type:complete
MSLDSHYYIFQKMLKTPYLNLGGTHDGDILKTWGFVVGAA